MVSFSRFHILLTFYTSISIIHTTWCRRSDALFTYSHRKDQNQYKNKNSWISKFLVFALRLLICIPEVSSPKTKAVNENQNVHHDLRMKNDELTMNVKTVHQTVTVLFQDRQTEMILKMSFQLKFKLSFNLSFKLSFKFKVKIEKL